VLQAHCARCHNEQYQGRFQLVPIKTRVDRTPDALRHNLDAALALVNPQNPASSELLTSTLRQHGGLRNARPIYPGSNNRYYQVLSAWVGGLRSTKVEADASTPEAGRTAPDASEPFAADRARIGQARDGRPQAPSGGDAKVPLPKPYAPNLGVVIPDQDPAHPKEFPIPFAISGVRPSPPGGTPAAKDGGPTTPSAAGKAPASGPAPSPAGAAAKPSPNKAPVKPAAKAETADDATAPKTPSKPVKLNPAVLEQLLRNRNESRAAPQ
jgi:hypothetical protein